MDVLTNALVGFASLSGEQLIGLIALSALCVCGLALRVVHTVVKDRGRT